MPRRLLEDVTEINRKNYEMKKLVINSQILNSSLSKSDRTRAQVQVPNEQVLNFHLL